MKPGVVRVSRTYPHPVEHVWRALTDRELLARWLMPNDFAPRVGHRFTFTTEPGPGFDGVVHCEVLELVPPRRLVLSWRGGPLDTRVTFELEAVDGGTRLDLEHTGFRGLRARLVQRLLALGNRTLYGERLPAVLDETAGGPPTGDGGDEACMEPEQRWIVRALRWIGGRR